MAHRRKSVRKIKETIRLHEAGFNKKQIAGSVTTSRKTVRKYIERVESLGLTYAEIEKMAPKQLYARLFPVKPEDGRGLKPRPDWQIIYNDMKKKSVTLVFFCEQRLNNRFSFGNESLAFMMKSNFMHLIYQIFQGLNSLKD